MEEVKRYTIDFSDGETAEGVLYTDYAAEVADWAKSNKALAVELDTFRTEVNALRDERDSLRSQLEAANERHFQAVYAVGEEIEKNEALQAQLTAQPDGVRRWRFVENYLGRACVAVEGSGELVLDTRTLDEQVSQACRLLVEAHNKALADPAPAREDGVRAAIQRAVSVTLDHVMIYAPGTVGASVRETVEAMCVEAALQALAAPAPSECYACKYSQGPHTHKREGI